MRLMPQWQRWLPVLLLLLVASSALGVVATKQRSRALQSELQVLAAERERIKVEFNQLRLERGTIGAHARIEAAATEQLDMQVPDDYTIVQVPR